MGLKKRIPQAVTLLYNLATESVVAATLAGHLQRERYVQSPKALEEACENAFKDWPTVTSKVASGGPEIYGCDLFNMIQECERIRTIAGSIDVAKVMELRRQGEDTRPIFENKLANIASAVTTPRTGVLARCKKIITDAGTYEISVLALVGQVKKNAMSIKTSAWLFRTPDLRAMLFAVSPVTLIVATLAVVIGIYFILIYQSHEVSDVAQMRSHVISDIQHNMSLWHRPDLNFFEKVRDTVDFLSKSASLVPLLLLPLSGFLYFLQRCVMKDRATRAKLLCLQQYVDRAGRRLRLGHSFIVRGFTMTTVYTSGSGNIVNVADYMKDVVNTVNQQISSSTESESAKQLVKELGAKIEAVAPSIDQPKMEGLTKGLRQLSGEMSSAEPEKDSYEFALDRIKKTAAAVGQIGLPIISVVDKLRSLLLP